MPTPMSFIRSLPFALGAFVAGALPPVASGRNLFVNGSFEEGVLTSTDNYRLTKAAPDWMPGWTYNLTGSSSNLTIYQRTNAFADLDASDGNQYIYIGGANAGNFLEYNFSLTAGVTYDFSFDLAINGGNNSFQVYFEGAGGRVLDTGNYTIPGTPVQYQWETHDYSFTVEETGSYAMRLAPTVNSTFFVDNFSLAAVPEPTTYAAFFGTGALAFAFWRRRQRRVRKFLTEESSQTAKF